MSNQFLVYWITEQIEASLEEGAIPHAAGNQLARVAVGDRLWICGRIDGRAALYTIGFLDVALKLGAKAAQAEMARRFPGYKIWNAAWHVLTKRGEECPTRLVPLEPLYTSLRFDSPTSPRLQLDGGHPNAQQLQSMRRLTPNSAKALAALWHRSAKTGSTKAESASSRSPDRGAAVGDLAALAELDSLDSQRTALTRLEQQLARQVLLRGSTTGPCAFCGHDLPAGLLVAAHIKPRAMCTLAEKKAVDTNIIGLCRLGCDELYERGYLEVKDGVITAGPAPPMTEAVNQAIAALVGRRVGGWSRDREPYFRWRRLHRANWAW